MIDPSRLSPPKLFEFELQLPDPRIAREAGRLVGFRSRYERLRNYLRILLSGSDLEHWSRRFYGASVPLVDLVNETYPLVLFYGDVGCGKTATARAAANSLATELHRSGMFWALSTRVRGEGHVGEISALLNRAFDRVVETPPGQLAFLLIDEADSVAESRAVAQSHHEDKVAVNTLIQRLDELMRTRRDVLVVLATNRIESLDPALVRRAGWTERFDRPTLEERLEFLDSHLAGCGLDERTLSTLAELTGARNGSVGYSYSDMRNRLLLYALGEAFPDRAITGEDLIRLATSIAPSPSMIDA